MALLEVHSRGLYCPAGDFFIDPWRRVDRALITHAHTDHARPGHRGYLAPPSGAAVLRQRLGHAIPVQELPFGRALELNGVRVSFHPAGHILGSAQVRVEHRGEIWVVSGDYKTERDRSCETFEPVRCHTFITESTFALPRFNWAPQAEIFGAINHWWRTNQAAGRASVVFAYALGKSQRVLAGIEAGLGPVFLHPDARKFLEVYRAEGVSLPAVGDHSLAAIQRDRAKALVIAPPSARGTPWLRRFEPLATAFASGWMHTASPRRGTDAGFALSDHCDWKGLTETIRETGAERILVTHGYVRELVRWLKLQGRDAAPLPSPPRNADPRQLELAWQA